MPFFFWFRFGHGNSKPLLSGPSFLCEFEHFAMTRFRAFFQFLHSWWGRTVPSWSQSEYQLHEILLTVQLRLVPLNCSPSWSSFCPKKQKKNNMTCWERLLNYSKANSGRRLIWFVWTFDSVGISENALVHLPVVIEMLHKSTQIQFSILVCKKILAMKIKMIWNWIFSPKFVWFV